MGGLLQCLGGNEKLSFAPSAKLGAKLGAKLEKVFEKAAHFWIKVFGLADRESELTPSEGQASAPKFNLKVPTAA
jgi:hypothetical protein